MLKVKSGEVAQVLDFVAVDSVDLKTRETGISAWTVYRSRGGGTATVFTTPTVTEKSAGNMPGVYHLLMDEDMTITSGKRTEVMTFHITATGVAPITISIALFDEANWAIGSVVTAGSVTGAVGSVTGAVGSVTGNVAGNVTGSVGSVASGGITAGSLASATITAAKFGAGAIDATAIATDAITAVKIATGAITAAKFGAGAIDAAAIADGAIDAATFAAGAINAAAIAADAIGASELAADAVTEIAVAVAAGSVASVVGAVGSVAGNVGGNVVGSIGSVATGGITAASIAADAIGAAELAADAVAEIAAAVAAPSAAVVADAVLDEVLSGHTIAGTLGERLAGIRSATAQTGAAGTITLDASASAVDDFYNSTLIVLVAGTGAGQSRFISDYAGATKVATVNGNWVTTPGATSQFVIVPFGSIPGATAPSADDVANAVWDEPRGGHAIAGSYGESVVVDATGLSAAAVNEIADGLLDKTGGVETGLTVRQGLRLLAGVEASKMSGGGTNTLTFRNFGDSKNRVIATVDQDANRLTLVYDLT